MDSIRTKFKEFHILKEIDDKTYLVERKNKTFVLNKFNPRSEEGMAEVYSVRKISNSGIRSPKLVLIDSKQGFIIRENVEGVLLSDLLLQGKMEEKIIEQLFLLAYVAKINKMTLNYEPDNLLFSNGKVIYLNTFYIPYDVKKDLSEKYLPLYFETKELQKYFEKRGVFYDKSRIKPDYETNKEMVLMTCKYYR